MMQGMICLLYAFNFLVLLACLRAVCYTLARRHLHFSVPFPHGTAINKGFVDVEHAAHDEAENNAGADRFVGLADR